MITPKKMLYRPSSPFRPFSQSQTSERTPELWDRINRKTRCGLPNVILIEGGGQVGKSTLGMEICRHYDPDFTIIYNLQQLLDLMTQRVKAFEAGDRSMLYKWLFFDEPQMEALKTKHHDQRNIIIGQIVGAWGELKQNLVLALPDIDDISSRLYRNITIRIIVSADFKNGEVVRRADIFTARKDIQKKGYKWKSGGWFPIPEYKRPENYLPLKINNLTEKLGVFQHDFDRQNRKLYGKPEQQFIPTPISKERIAEIEAKFAESERKARLGLTTA